MQRPSRASGGAASAALSAFSATSVRVLIVVLLSVGLGWLTFAVLFHEDIVETSSEDGISGAQPGRPSVKRRSATHGSIGPVVKPRGGAFQGGGALRACSSLLCPACLHPSLQTW